MTGVVAIVRGAYALLGVLPAAPRAPRPGQQQPSPAARPLEMPCPAGHPGALWWWRWSPVGGTEYERIDCPPCDTGGGGQ